MHCGDLRDADTAIEQFLVFPSLSLVVSALVLAAISGQGPRLIDCDNGHQSPGFANKDGQTGNAARATAQRSPQSITDLAWERLSGEPATSLGDSLGATWAELARRHLMAVYAAAPDGATSLLAVPEIWIQSGHHQRVLETAHAAGLPAVGTIDRGLAAAALGRSHALTPGAPVLHLDLLRGEGILTTLHYDGQRLRTAGTPIPVPSGGGHRALEEAIMLGLDGRMAEDSGVLPSEHPELAQALYDQLPTLLDTLRTASAAAMEASSSRLVLTRDEVGVFCRKLNQRLASAVESACGMSSSKGVHLLKLGASAAQVPGLRETLASVRGVVVEELPVGHAALAAAHLCEALGLDAVSQDARPEPIVELSVDVLVGYADLAPIDNAATFADPEPAENPDRQFHTGPSGFITRDVPTHLLFQGRALPLEGNSFIIGKDPGEDVAGVRVVEDFPGLAPVHARLTREGGAWHAEPGANGVPLLLNQQPIAEQAPLQTGDILTLGDTGLKTMLIHTVD